MQRKFTSNRQQSAVIAQVTTTALQSSNMEPAHWSARAILTLALLSALFSVLLASAGYIVLAEKFFDSDFTERFKLFVTSPNGSTGRRASLRAALLLSTPGGMLVLALLFFVTGLGIGLGSQWSNGNDDRNIFILLGLHSLWVTPPQHSLAKGFEEMDTYNAAIAI